MGRQHDYSAPKDYGLHIDNDLEKANAKVLADTWKKHPKKPNESSVEHLRRVSMEFHKTKKQRNAFGGII
jgi:uncharacterized protein (DUF2267 family)